MSICAVAVPHQSRHKNLIQPAELVAPPQSLWSQASACMGSQHQCRMLLLPQLLGNHALWLAPGHGIEWPPASTSMMLFPSVDPPALSLQEVLIPVTFRILPRRTSVSVSLHICHAQQHALLLILNLDGQALTDLQEMFARGWSKQILGCPGALTLLPGGLSTLPD